MYVRVIGMHGGPDVLIKDPSIYCSYIEGLELYRAVIENEYLIVKCFCKDNDEVHQAMNEMEKLRGDQIDGSPSDVVNFSGWGVKVESKKDSFLETIKMLKFIAAGPQKKEDEKTKEPSK